MKESRNRLVALLAIVIAFASIGVAQSNPGTAQKTAAVRHDIDGVWGLAPATPGTGSATSYDCCLVDPRLRPPMTPWAQARFDAAVPSSPSPGPEGDRVIPGKENDPALSCFPSSFPKVFSAPVTFEIMSVPGRVLMFVEMNRGWRQIWTDGRKLPEDPPELLFDGYSVGRWEGDTFIVESSGFNDKLWLDYFGDPRSEQLRMTERYRRVDEKTLTIAVTIDDPKAYTKPWVNKPIRYTLRPGTEIGEWYCTIEDEGKFNEKIRFPTFVPNDKKE